jgi:fimbrial isopeptide formation D2 family protein/uncharacterized repeat protein (TIGR01451 family)
MQVGDEFWVTIKTTPGPGTNTGVGGYQTFYVPDGYQVLDAAYAQSSSIDPRGFVPIPMKGQSPISLGAGANGQKIGTGLTGYTYPSPNIVGINEAPVTSTGLARGTLSGVYADTGIFFSTDPRTAFNSYGASPSGGTPAMTNNSGDLVGEWNSSAAIGKLGVMTLWDSHQLRAFGRKDVAPIIDTADGRGNAPWGMASAVAGPHSGYAWSFNFNAFNSTSGTNDQKIRAGIEVGPWKRIQFPGSQVSKDTPGSLNNSLGYAGVDASTLGHNFSSDGPLPAGPPSGQIEQVNAIRFAIGQLEFGRPEYAAIKLRVLANPGTHCNTIYADAFGGDAGGTDNGKDHLWRYFDPTVVSLTPCSFLQKRAADPLLAPGGSTYFDITFANAGNLTLPNVLLRDTLPTGLSYISATPSPTSISGNILTWNVGTVAPKEVRTVRVYVKATAIGALSNVVTATSGGNPLATAEEIIEVSTRALLRSEKTVTPSSAAPGTNVQYTITVYNEGTGLNGTPLVLTDSLPPGFTFVNFVSATLNGAAISPPTITTNSSNNTTPIFTVNQAIQAKKTLTITFTANIGPTVSPGTYFNQVEMSVEGKRIPPIPQAPVTVGGGQIGDTVFRDWNGNASQDPNEEGIPSLSVQLYDATDSTLITSSTTNTTGQYLFTGLQAGTYQVRIPSPPSGYTPIFDLDGIGTTNRTAVTITNNQKNLTADFGYAPVGTGSIGSRVFEDLNNNGLRDSGEPGIPNTIVRLLTPNGVEIATTTTNASGVYSFTNLALGLNYSVICNLAGPATYFAADPYTITTSNPRTVTNLTGGVTTINFGFYRNLPATLGDQVYFDADGSNTFNAGDSPLANITVNLFASNGTTLLATTTSANNGTYQFTGLVPGTYVVRVDTSDTDIPGNYSATTSQYLGVVLTSGQTDLTRDFPFIATPSPLSKTVNLTNASRGSNLTYTLIPNYTGSNILTNVQIIDPVPAGSTFVNPSASPTPSSQPANGGTGNVTWSLGSTSAASNGSQSFSSSAPATIELRASSPVAVDNGTTVLTIAKPSGLQVGDVMIANFAMRGTSTVDVTGSGWTLVRGAAFETSLKLARATLLYKVANATDVAAPDFDFTLAGSGGNHGGCGAITAFSGVDATGGFTPNGTPGGPFDVTPNSISVDTAGSANPTATALTTASANAAVIMFVMAQNNPTSSGWTTTSPGALTELYDGGQPGTNRSQVSAAWARKTSPGSTGTGNVTMTSTKWGTILLALKPGITTAYTYDTTTALSSNRSMVKSGDSITVTLTATISNATGSPFPVTVTPPSISVSGTNGASAAFSAAPASQTLNNNGSLIFTYVSTSVTAGSSPGILTFRATPSDNKGGTWGQATANTVIATPTLSYTARINTISPPLAVHNIAQITSTSGITSGNSNQVTTLVDGSIGDFVWADEDGDGLQAGESGIPGVRVFIDLDSSGTYNAGLEPFAITDSTGFYRIQGLSAATYSVRYDYSTVPAGYVPTTPLALSVVLAATAQYSAADFGLLPPPPLGPNVSEIGDTLWIDTNSNGLVDPSETLLPDIDVLLYADLNNNGLVDSGDVLLTTTSTDSTGKYLFTGLNAGNYIVDVVEIDPQFPAGLVLISGGTLITNPPTNNVWKVSPASGQTILSADFGYKFPGSIGDFLWYDTNGNGLADETDFSGGPRPVPNGTVVLYTDANANGHVDPEDSIIRVEVTGDGSPAYPLAPNRLPGQYLFENLPPGNYISKVSEQEVPSPTSGITSTMIVTTGEYLPVTLGTGPGQSMQNLTSDFGFIEAALVEGLVFHDVNQNGVFDSSEPILPNITTFAYSPGTDGQLGTLDDVLAATTTTDTNGEFQFILDPGPYRITYNTTQIPSSLSVVTTTLEYQIVAVAGTETTGLNFGVDNNGQIGDTLFADLNSNGSLNPGEPTLSGITVNLYLDLNGDGTIDLLAGDLLLDTQVTNATGNYLFTGLADTVGSQRYLTQVVTSTIPPTYQTTPTAFPFGAVPATSSFSTTLTGGQTISIVDFGYPLVPDIYHSISGTVYDDNGAGGGGITNGSQGGSEPGIANVQLTIQVDSNADSTYDQSYVVFTDPSGFYSLGGIKEGANVLITVDPNSLPSTAYTITGDPDSFPLSETFEIIDLQAPANDLDFGYIEVLGSIAGTIVKGDGNGIADSGETTIGNVTVSLRFAGADSILGTSDDVLTTTTSASNGTYFFENLLPGPYEITTTLPSNYLLLADTDGGNPNSINVSLSLGSTVLARDFEYQAASISGTVWTDANADAIRQGTEPTLENIRVFLDLNTNGTLDIGEPSTLTQPNGTYSFTQLVAQTYVVSIDPSTLPSNVLGSYDVDGISTLHLATIALGINEDRANVDFGYYQLGAISGTVTRDIDNNNSGDEPLETVTITLLDSLGATITTTTTDASGFYEFLNLAPGNCTVVETDLAGYQSVTPNSLPTTVVAGETATADFIDEQLATISGSVLADLDGDNITDTPLPNVTITLKDNLGATVAITTTDSIGSYEFLDVPAGNYTLEQAQPSGYTSLGDVDGGDLNIIGDLIPIVLLPGQNLTAQNFTEAIFGAISGTVTRDIDNNDSGDLPIENVTLTLLDNLGATIATTTTDIDGNYEFLDVPAGNYTVVQTDLSGYQSVTPNSLPTTVVAGQTATADFVDEQLGTLSGCVHQDLDGDGDGDQPIPNVTLSLLDSLGATVTTTLTDAFGIYTFTNVAPGSYTIVQTQPSGLNSTSDADVTPDLPTSPVDAPNADPLDNLIPVTLAAGETDDGNDFVEYAPATLSGYVLADTTNDLTGDTPISGVTLTLLDNNGAPVGSPTTSDLNGFYQFTNLAPGSYSVAQTQPLGYISIADQDSGNLDLIGDLTPIVLAPGASSSDNTFVERVAPSFIYNAISGQIVSGASVSVTGPGNVLLIQDGSTGSYAFMLDPANPIAGSYTLTLTPPAGFVIDPTRPVAGPSLDPTSGPNPATLGSPASSGSLVDFTAGANPYYLTLDLAPGDPVVVQNNLPVVPAKPTTWAAWQYLNPLNGSNAPADNPDSDRYDNLQEFAFCFSPATGLKPRCPISVLIDPATGRADVRILRVTGITGVTYTLEAITTLDASPAGWSDVTSILPTITYNTDGTEWATYSDVGSLAPASTTGFFRVRLELDTDLNGNPESTSRTEAAGVARRTFATQCETFAMPFIKCDLFGGSINAVIGQALSITSSIGTADFAAALVSGTQYYVEVLSGDHAGHRFELNEAASLPNAIAIDTTSPLNTLPSLPATLASDLIAVRSHQTLAEVFKVTDFPATNDPATSTRIQFHSGNAFTTYWLFLAGGNPYWATVGDNTAANVNSLLLPPAAGQFVRIKSGTPTATFSGLVRSNPMAAPLIAGSNLVAGGWPIDQSPNTRAMTPANGFFGSNDPAKADKLQIWKGDATPNLSGYDGFFLLQAGAFNQWSPEQNASLSNENTSLLMPSLRSAFIRSRTGNASYIMPNPWTP